MSTQEEECSAPRKLIQPDLQDLDKLLNFDEVTLSGDKCVFTISDKVTLKIVNLVRFCICCSWGGGGPGGSWRGRRPGQWGRVWAGGGGGWTGGYLASRYRARLCCTTGHYNSVVLTVSTCDSDVDQLAGAWAGGDPGLDPGGGEAHQGSPHQGSDGGKGSKHSLNKRKFLFFNNFIKIAMHLLFLEYLNVVYIPDKAFVPLVCFAQYKHST